MENNKKYKSLRPVVIVVCCNSKKHCNRLNFCIQKILTLIIIITMIIIMIIVNDNNRNDNNNNNDLNNSMTATMTTINN